MKKKAVIWGASGFVGINLAKRLTSESCEVHCISRTASSHWPDEVTFHETDLRVTSDEVANVMKNALVFHLTGATRPSNDTTDAVSEVTTDVVPTLNYLELTRDLNCRWIFSSSGGTVYGTPNTSKITEDHPTRPISSYGVNKLATEGYFQVYKSIHGTDYSIARIANLYGPHQNPNSGQGLVAVLINKIIDGNPIEIWGDGCNIRDYIYVTDAVEALSVIANNGKSGQVYNVGSGVGVSVNEIIKSVSSILNASPEIIRRPSRGMDVRCNVLDIERIRNELLWQPATDLNAGLKHSCEWFLKGRSR